MNKSLKFMKEYFFHADITISSVLYSTIGNIILK